MCFITFSLFLQCFSSLCFLVFAMFFITFFSLFLQCFSSLFSLFFEMLFSTFFLVFAMFFITFFLVFAMFFITFFLVFAMFFITFFRVFAMFFITFFPCFCSVFHHFFSLFLQCFSSLFMAVPTELQPWWSAWHGPWGMVHSHSVAMPCQQTWHGNCLSDVFKLGFNKASYILGNWAFLRISIEINYKRN